MQRLGIPLVAHNPQVGRNLQEHLTIALQFRLRSGRDSENRAFSGLTLLGNLLRYVAFRSGPLATAGHQVGAALRSDPGESRPDLRVMFAPFSRVPGARAFEAEPGMQLIGFVLRPESRGELEIVSREPVEPPRIRPNYLATEADRRRTVRLVRAMRELAEAPSMKEFLVCETPETAGAHSDAEVLELVSRRGAPGFHTTSTCVAGAAGAPLDPRLRVRGVSGLRVADCSILPSIISGHTQAPAMAIGWRAAELMLEDLR
jgi:choline dehydrogenase-like flavoprotein